jgi:polysaccharide export outer membrane protein
MRLFRSLQLSGGSFSLLGLLLFLSAGCETPSGPGVGAAPSQAPPAIARQRVDEIQPGDRLTIEFSDVNPSPPGTIQVVRDDGTITLPLSLEVKAAGKLKGELQKEIKDLYVPRYFRRLTVNIKTDDRFFFVGGEVRLPARQAYIGQMTVLKAVQSAGDFTDFANRKNVKIIRQNGRVDTENCIKARKNPKLDLPVFPGDIVHVERRIL